MSNELFDFQFPSQIDAHTGLDHDYKPICKTVHCQYRQDSSILSYELANSGAFIGNEFTKVPSTTPYHDNLSKQVEKAPVITLTQHWATVSMKRNKIFPHKIKYMAFRFNINLITISI